MRWIKMGEVAHLNKNSSPSQVAQLVGALSHTPEGCGFDFRSGHMPGLPARSPASGIQEATGPFFTHTLMFLSLSFSNFLLEKGPLSLKIN